MSHARIARELHVSRTTVVKYASREDFSPRPAGRAGRTLIDSGYAEIVEGWLTADLRLPRKQRHTAMRVWQRLRDEHGFEGSYPSVQRWVKRWRERHRAESEGYARLAWAPGTAQVDFGQARASIAGVERVVHFLVVSYPYSNMRYVAALPGETSGCVCHGLGEVFARVGMAPRVVVFDNATGVGHRNADGTVTQTVMFQRFCAQYGFEARFCNPYSGNEKGSVENAVGFVRRNLMVPVPSAEGYQALTRAWFDACERLAQADHYRLGVPVAGLFESEKEHMLPLPSAAFDPVEWRSVKADRTGTVLIDSNRYLAGPKWHSMRLQAGVRVSPDRVARPRRRAHHHPGTCMGTLARHTGRPRGPACRHRAQAPVMGREPDPWGFPRTRTRLARPHGRAGTLLADLGHPARRRDVRLPGRGRRRRRDHQGRAHCRPGDHRDHRGTHPARR